MKPKLRLVECGSHGDGQLAYVVCLCIVDGNAKPVIRDMATPTMPGSVCCERGGPDHAMNELRVACARCMRKVLAERAPELLRPEELPS